MADASLNRRMTVRLATPSAATVRQLGAALVGERCASRQPANRAVEAKNGSMLLCTAIRPAQRNTGGDWRQPHA